MRAQQHSRGLLMMYTHESEEKICVGEARCRIKSRGGAYEY
jgi:hypothetical protein